MKKKRRSLMVVLTTVIILLAACGNSTDESVDKTNNQSTDSNSTQNGNDNSSNTDKNTTEKSSEDRDNTQLNDKEDSSDNTTANSNDDESQKPSDSDITESKKEEYLKKLNDTKNKTDKMEAVDSTTYALKKVEDDRWKIWDGLLNDIYGVLKGQLTTEEMDQLRKEQRNWIKNRDAAALEASKKYEGGTQETLEYSAVAANLTKERCYKLVENYMK